MAEATPSAVVAGRRRGGYHKIAIARAAAFRLHTACLLLLRLNFGIETRQRVGVAAETLPRRGLGLCYRERNWRGRRSQHCEHRDTRQETAAHHQTPRHVIQYHQPAGQPLNRG